jgi:hypothetical protein
MSTTLLVVLVVSGALIVKAAWGVFGPLHEWTEGFLGRAGAGHIGRLTLKRKAGAQVYRSARQLDIPSGRGRVSEGPDT